MDLIDEDGNRLCLLANPSEMAHKFVNLRGYYALVGVSPDDTDGSGDAKQLQIDVGQVTRPQVVADFLATLGHATKRAH